LNPFGVKYLGCRRKFTMNNGANILIVDDDPTHRFMLKSVIDSWGWFTDAADDGATALQMIQKGEKK
jgi:CheY-like chemotaxis protein